MVKLSVSHVTVVNNGFNVVKMVDTVPTVLIPMLFPPASVKAEPMGPVGPVDPIGPVTPTPVNPIGPVEPVGPIVPV